MKKDIGRNDLCHCGSKIKYKKCCLSKDSMASNAVIDFKWHKIRQTEGAIIERHLTPFVQSLPKDILEMAWNDFIVENELILDAQIYDGLRYNFFIPWLYFDWVSDGHALNNPCDNITISQLYLQLHAKNFSEYEKEFIQTINKTHFSFYIVLEAISGQSLTIKDLLLDTIYTVKEKSASQALITGHIIFARVLEMDTQCIMVGMSPYALTPNKSKIVLDFKKTIKNKARKPLDSTMLRNTYSFELRYLYFDLLDESFNAPHPQLYNTDDEPINMCAVHFTLHTTTEIACMALAPLMLEPDAQTQFKRALKDK
ncbi:MAG: SEC-C domain-containing protein, partial [Rickettsiaceae bacterium]|nr:SEC-C domain-containing protein [Rickettsiaceae bacterium]